MEGANFIENKLNNIT